MLPIAAAKVTSPEGTNGSKRSETTKKKAFLPLAFTSCCTLGKRSNLFWDVFLNPFRYNQKATAAPAASPAKEMSVPFQKPKNKILAAVINTLGTRPNTATAMLNSKLIIIASCGYCSKRCKTVSFKLKVCRCGNKCL